MNVTSSSTMMADRKNGQIDFIASAIEILPIADPTNSTDPIGGTPQQFAALIKKDIARWAEAIKASGVKPE